MNFFQRFAVALSVAIAGILTIPAAVHAATLFLQPGSANFVTGETVTVAVKVDTDGQAINNAGATIMYPAELLNLTNVSLADSIFSYWTVQPSGTDSPGQ